MIRFYYHPTPNPLKISLFLEETGLSYEVVAVDTSKGEQHQPASSIPVRSCFTSPRRQAGSAVRPKTGRSFCPGSFSSRPALDLSPGRRAFSVSRARGPGLRRQPLPAGSRAALPGN